MKARSCCTCAALVFALLVTAPARAGETTIDISALANEPWSNLPNGGNFPTGNQTLGGVPFAIPTGPNNWWSAAQATNYGPGTATLTVPVGVAGVTSAFTLFNTLCGQPGPASYLSVTFNGSGGATYTKPLTGGLNVRDYNNDGCENAINGTTTVNVFDNGLGQRLDRQEYVLPASFAGQVLASVTITDTGNYLFSRAIFAGLTVSTCASNVAAGIHVVTGKILYHPQVELYSQEIFVSNVSTETVNGPLFVVLDGLSSAATVRQQAGQTSCWAPIGSPYVIAIPSGDTLAPKTTDVLKIEYSDPSGAALTYTPLAIASQGATP